MHHQQLCIQHTSSHCQSITLPQATDSCCNAAAGVKQAASHGLEGQVITARRAALQVLTDTSQQHAYSEQTERRTVRLMHLLRPDADATTQHSGCPGILLSNLHP